MRHELKLLHMHTRMVCTLNIFSVHVTLTGSSVRIANGSTVWFYPLVISTILGQCA